jgi:hypothetical protein
VLRPAAILAVVLVTMQAAAVVRAQATWIVNSGGGPGVHFTDLAAAVAAAAHGDTVLVFPDAFNSAYAGFTTDKGIAVIGVNRPRLGTSPVPVQVQNVPAGRSFRLAGFDAPRNQELHVVISGCAGNVHLEDLHAVEHGALAPTWPAIDIAGCTLVTLHDVEDFGMPAVRVQGGTLLATACRLGVTSLGLGGGPCLFAANATVQVTEPRFEATSGTTVPAIMTVDSQLFVGGTAAGYIQGSQDFMGGAAAAIHATGGLVIVDPGVRLNPFTPVAQPITGTAVVAIAPVPASFVANDAPGLVLAATFTAPPGSAVIGFLGLPVAPLPTPLGTQLLASSPLATLTVAVVPAAGTVAASTPVPASLPRGSAFGVQSAVLANGVVALGSACHFVVH